MALSRNEIQALQRKNRLTPDGIVGPRTQNVIDTEILAKQLAKQDDLLVNPKKSIERAMDIETEKKADKTRLEKFSEFFEGRWNNKPSNDIVMDPESYRLFTTPGALENMPSRYEGKRVSYQTTNTPKRDTAYLVNDGIAETLFVAGRRMGKTEINTQILEALIRNASDEDIKRYLRGEMKLDIKGPITNPDGLRGVRADQLIIDEYANVDPRAYQYLIKPSGNTIMTSAPTVSEESVANFMEAMRRADSGAIIVPKGTEVEIIQAVYVDPCEPYSLVDFIEEG